MGQDRHGQARLNPHSQPMDGHLVARHTNSIESVKSLHGKGGQPISHSDFQHRSHNVSDVEASILVELANGPITGTAEELLETEGKIILTVTSLEH